MKGYAYKDDSAKMDCIGYALLVSVLAALMVGMAGCSFKVETGWHGKTGRDDRVQTRLVNDGDEYYSRPQKAHGAIPRRDED